VAGLGLEVPLSGFPWTSGISVLQDFSARIEYDYHGKGRSIGASGIASDRLTLVANSMEPHEQSGIVSLVWNF
jgi:hypothetical protein